MATQLAIHRERGSVMLVAVLVILLLAISGFSMVEAVTSGKDEGSAAGHQQQRILLAESALNAALHDLQQGGSGTLGTPAAPIALGAGAIYTLATDRGDGTITVFAVGRYARDERVIRARIRRSRPVFDHAIFAGNSSGDPDYEMKFGGTGTHADQINGDIYSGGGILVEGHADITGSARATDSISGMAGDTGVAQPALDFTAVDWSDPAIVDVAAQFSQWGTRTTADAGGKADQLPEGNSAHIFRRNPDDRETETGSTTKDDYFLEDPYEPWQTDPKDNGSSSPMISIDDGSGLARQTYYIDGNLWIHSPRSMSFMLASAGGGGTQVTFVVRGNITFSDSFRLEDTARDAVGFIALKDPDVPDSGNIYLGDPAYGTLSEVHGFLYAENDFLDINLDDKGSKAVRLLGSMTAGNHVAIERTYKGGHSKLTVDWDKRLSTGEASLPFLSTDLPSASGRAVLEAWVESPIVDLGPIAPESGPAPLAASLAPLEGAK